MQIKARIKYINGPNPNGMKTQGVVTVTAPSKTESAVMEAIRKAHPNYLNIVILSIE